MLYIIDGTGESNDDEYEKTMAGGFCVALRRCVPSSRYNRGPEVSGVSTFKIAEVILAEILALNQKQPKEKIFLAGHSRGGAALIYIAKKLAKISVPVEAMFLFDAVDRTPHAAFHGALVAAIKLLISPGAGQFRALPYSITGEPGMDDLSTIPANVGMCYHAVRDTSLANHFQPRLKAAQVAYSACLKSTGGKGRGCDALGKAFAELIEADTKMKLCMRTQLVLASSTDNMSIDFGNCGMKGESKPPLIKRFSASHGALGGAPITDARAPKELIAADAKAWSEIWSWMSSHLSREGLMGPVGRPGHA